MTRRDQSRDDLIVRLRASGMKFEAIARQLGITRQRAHKLYKRAIGTVVDRAPTPS